VFNKLGGDRSSSLSRIFVSGEKGSELLKENLKNNTRPKIFLK